MEGGHLKVAAEEPQVIPPLSSGGLRTKGERRMVPLRITGSKVFIQRNHVHAGGGGGWRRLVVGWMVETPDFSFPAPSCDMTRRRESTVLGAGIRRTALNLGRASRSWCHRSVVHPFCGEHPHARVPSCQCG